MLKLWPSAEQESKIIDRFKKIPTLRVKMLAVVLASVVFASVDATAGVSLWHLDYSADCKYLFLYRVGFSRIFFVVVKMGIFQRKNEYKRQSKPRCVRHVASHTWRIPVCFKYIYTAAIVKLK